MAVVELEGPQDLVVLLVEEVEMLETGLEQVAAVEVLP